MNYLLAVALSLWNVAAIAHGNAIDRIHTLDIELSTLEEQEGTQVIINAQPTWLAYLRRCDLHRREKNSDAALVDFYRVLDLQPDNTAAMLAAAQTHVDLAKHSETLVWTSRILRNHSTHGKASLVRARALVAMTRFDEAESSFRTGINRLQTVTPENFIELASIVEKTSPLHAQQDAVVVPDEGVRQLGNAITLHNAALRIELNAGLTQQALARMDSLLEHEPTLYQLQQKRSAVLASMGRHEQAKESLQRLLVKIESLPMRRRLSQAMQSLIRQCEYDLEHLRNELMAR